MPKITPITAQKLIKVLMKLDFEEVRIRGSHHFFVHPISKKSTTIPVHRNEVLGIGILRQILRDIDLPLDRYEKLRLGK
ncbi:MAG: type II toxin-antitoxin system HicA family toxin [Patescibacteria group bacterium]